MEAGSPRVTGKESGVWVITMSPLDPEIMRDRDKVLYKYDEQFS
jgi:hypothetical protein